MELSHHAFCRRITVLVACVLISCCARSIAQEGASLWGVKPISLRELRKKAKFQVIVPKVSNIYQFRKAELVWIGKGRPLFPQMPARQVACLFYTLNGYKGSFAVIQAKSLGKSQAEDNLYQAVAEGRFFRNLKIGASLWRGTNKDIDFMVVTHVIGVTGTKQDSLVRPLFKAMEQAKNE